MTNEIRVGEWVTTGAALHLASKIVEALEVNDATQVKVSHGTYYISAVQISYWTPGMGEQGEVAVVLAPDPATGQGLDVYLPGKPEDAEEIEEPPAGLMKTPGEPWNVPNTMVQPVTINPQDIPLGDEEWAPEKTLSQMNAALEGIKDTLVLDDRGRATCLCTHAIDEHGMDDEDRSCRLCTGCPRFRVRYKTL